MQNYCKCIYETIKCRERSAYVWSLYFGGSFLIYVHSTDMIDQAISKIDHTCDIFAVQQRSLHETMEMNYCSRHVHIRHSLLFRIPHTLVSSIPEKCSRLPLSFVASQVSYFMPTSLAWLYYMESLYGNEPE